MHMWDNLIFELSLEIHLRPLSREEIHIPYSEKVTHFAHYDKGEQKEYTWGSIQNLWDNLMAV